MQDQTKNQNGMDAEITQSKSQEYRRKFQQFSIQFPKAQTQFQQSTDRIYYIVSNNFLKQWQKFCKETSLTRRQPQPMNIDLVNAETGLLLDGKLQTEDFQIVNKQIYQLLKDFPVHSQLKRVSYGEPGQKRIPILTIPISYLTLNQKDLQQFDRKNKTRANLKLNTIKSLSANNSIDDIISQIQSEQMLSKTYTTRLWKHQKDVTLDKLFTHIVDSCKPLGYDSMKIKGLGKKIQNTGQKIGQLNLEQGDYFILQCIEHEKVVITSPDEGKCQNCNQHKKLSHFCGCKMVGYCSQQCLKKDRKYHQQRCKLVEQEQLKKAVQMNMRPQSRRGIVGLQNLGNTCFMNSCLQCLSHTLPLTAYFLNKKYAQQINQDNPIGSKGRLAQSYANFIKNMWCEQQNVYRPYRLKNAIADINKMFSGYAQHDSQQLFSFLVDGLHQDLNRVKKKPYVESVDSNNRTDQQVSREGWLAYIKRNQSIISDNMIGQYKSKVICPDCGKQSITFDPYLSVTLPIPQKITYQMSMYVLSNNNESETIKINIQYKQKNIYEIYEKVAKLLGKENKSFLLYILTFNQNIYPFFSTPKTELFQKIENLSSYIFALQLSPEQQQLLQNPNLIQLACRFTKKQYGRIQSFWFKRPFFFNLETMTGLDIFNRVVKYLYADTYNLSEKRVEKEKEKQKSNKYRKVQQQIKPKSFEQYVAIMQKQRPFQIYLKWNKKIKTSSYSSTIETEFKEEKLISDNQLIKDLIDAKKISDYQIELRFNSEGLEHYNVQRLKNYTDKTKEDKNDWRSNQQQKNVTLNQCFEALQLPQQLEKGNQWYCSNCKDHKLATKQLYIYKTPQILILHLKRFKVKGIIRRSKNEANVDFPFDLDMSQYIVNPQPINSYIPFVQSQNLYLKPSYQLEVLTNAKPIYELFAVSNHYGSLGGGHYTAFAKNGDKWYSFNDSSVSGVQAGRVKGSGAYILFYRRKTN